MGTDTHLQATYDAIAADFATRYASQLGDTCRPTGATRGARRQSSRHRLRARAQCWLEQASVRVVGLDLSLGMLRQAQKITRSAPAQMKMTSLSLNDHCFDGVWCCVALLHLPKMQAPSALCEFRRVIRDGHADGVTTARRG